LTDRYDVTFALAEGSATGDAHMRGDARRLLQVLTNFMANAAKYSPPEGEVELGVAVRERQVRVYVSDRGPGIPAEFRDRVFERFAQADSSSTRTHFGVIIAGSRSVR
jgi:signal transduction histidine kinase